MTISSEASKVAYSGNGSTDRFAIPFPFLKQADLAVILRRKDGTEEAQVVSTHYGLETEDLGGTCVMNTAPAVGESLIIRRDPAIVQETAYEEGVPISAKAREDALDLVTMICQANRERVDRAVKFSSTSLATGATMPEPQAGRTIIWNAAGTDLENGPDISDAETISVNVASALVARDEAVAAQVAAETARDEVQAVAELNASGVGYDASVSGIEAATVQGALDALATDASGFVEVNRQMSLGFFQIMANQAMSTMDVSNRVLETFETSDGIDADNSSGYEHDADNDLVQLATTSAAQTIDFSNPTEFLQEDVKETITTLVVDTADASGHFTDGTTALTIAGSQNTTDVCNGGTATSSHGTASMCFDGVLATPIDWAPTPQTDLPWCGYLFSEEKLLWKVRWYNENADAAYYPALVGVDYTTDGGTTWTEAGTAGAGAAPGWGEFTFPDAVTCNGIRVRVATPTASYGGAYEWRLGEVEAYDMSDADVVKVIPGTRVVTDAGEVVISGVSNQGDGTDEVQFTGALAAGSHAVTSIYGTKVDAGVLSLNTVSAVDTFFTTSTADIDTTSWTDINAVTATETLNGQTALYALSFDGGATYQAWDGDSMEAVTFPCPDDGAGWMDSAALASLADNSLPDPEGAMRVAVALRSTDSSVSPEVEGVTIDVDAEATGMTVQLDALETAGVPDTAAVLAVIREVDALTLNTDLMAEVSRDGGVTWQSVPLAKVADFLTDRIVVEGQVGFSHPDGGGDEALLRFRSAAGTALEIHFASLGVVL